jgi:hypothetical protein
VRFVWADIYIQRNVRPQSTLSPEEREQVLDASGKFAEVPFVDPALLLGEKNRGINPVFHLTKALQTILPLLGGEGGGEGEEFSTASFRLKRSAAQIINYIGGGVGIAIGF